MCFPASCGHSAIEEAKCHPTISLGSPMFRGPLPISRTRRREPAFTHSSLHFISDAYSFPSFCYVSLVISLLILIIARSQHSSVSSVRFELHTNSICQTLGVLACAETGSLVGARQLHPFPLGATPAKIVGVQAVRLSDCQNLLSFCMDL